jgi:pimeloyl-ACP methyl ester carboxylesterase
MSTFILIHGAFTGGWIWRRVARALVKLGHDVFRPTLTGCGERSHLLRPETALATHVEDVAQLIFHEDLDRAVLVGHGYGGVIASAVAHRHGGKVAGLVYLDAVLPKRGASFLETAGQASARFGHGQDGPDWLMAAPAAESFAIECRELRRWLSVRLQPFPRACLATPYPYGPRDRELPGVYLRTAGPAPGLAAPVLKAQAAAARLLKMRVAELPTGPLPMVTNPGRLAKVLDAAVRDMGIREDMGTGVGSGFRRPGSGRGVRSGARRLLEGPEN